MKKLTAGVFATILGLTAMGAADAAVTSKGYVDSAVATAKAAAIADAEKYIDANELAADQATQNTTIANTYVNKTTYGTDKSALEQSIAGVKATADAAAPQATTYTKDEVDDAISRVDGATAIAGLEQSIADINTAQGVQDGKISALETASATHATKTELETAQNTLQTNINGVASRVTTAEGKITAIEGDYLKDADKTELQVLITAAQGDATQALQDASAAQTKANENAEAIDNLGNTYVTIADYDVDTAAQEAINTQVNTSLNSLATNKADKTDLNSLATKTELGAKADQTALTAEATTRAEADADLQAAIDAVGGGVEAITGATDDTDKGLYALTKIVADDGSVSYGWELIDREYAEADVTDNGK